MKCISIRQPWAYMILNCGKDIENRTWPTQVRGRVLIHAAKGMTQDEWNDAWDFAICEVHPVCNIPFQSDMQRGGIVGSVEIVDCVTSHDSPWFFGTYGFVLKNPRKIEFIPYKGQLGFFEVPDNVFNEDEIECPFRKEQHHG